ncbi:alpha/beta hydrolase [Daejeonella sp.]|jgi:acetyl esterase/lipase|uniref:alpha/beta hydrolase n=1 Tax=Daejeonella sp. TaxID=2805397 RepID=UPI003783773C
MYRLIFIFLFLLINNQGFSQTEIKLYEGLPPGNLKNENKEVYVKTARGRLDSVTIPSITVYRPEKPDPSRATVIICPGGGYRNLSIFDAGYQLASELNKVGITAIVLKYRTQIDGFYKDYSKIPLQDFDAAYEIVKNNALNWDIDLNKIGVIGFSAGGHLAAMRTVYNNNFKPAFSILVYPAISFMDELTSKKTVTRKYLLGDNPSEAQKIEYSSELHVSPGINPCLIIHAQDDGGVLVQNSLEFYNSLLKHKVKAQMLIYQEGGHGFALHNKVQDDYWLPMAINWLRFNKILINK